MEKNLISVVGFGPGNTGGMTMDAQRTLREAEVIVGYKTYIMLLSELLPDKEFLETGMREEEERCRMALAMAAGGRKVAVVCSGDSGVYGMAALLLEIMEQEKLFDRLEVRAIPGVTAALSGGALLGAPLSNDFMVVSLSDYLTPWERIEERLTAAASSDLCVVLYNPKSKERPETLKRVCELFLRYRGDETVCGVANRVGREGESSEVLTLRELYETSDREEIGMQSTVFIGNSKTREIEGYMVTSRGYELDRS